MKITIDLKLSNWNDIINANRRNKYLGNQLKAKRNEEHIILFNRKT